MNQFKLMVGKQKKNAFEGWFSKVDDIDNNLMFSVIWGYSTLEGDEHSFIKESLDGEMKVCLYKNDELLYEISSKRASMDMAF